AEWDGLEQKIHDVARYFDPRAVPEHGGFIDYLAGWLGTTFENEWTPKQRRKLLVALPRLLFAPRDEDDRQGSRRGPLRGLRDYLGVVLGSLGGKSVAGLPVIVEGFRERDYLMLSPEQSDLGRPLWGDDLAGRARLDAGVRLDEARLLSAGEPDLDVFGLH